MTKVKGKFTWQDSDITVDDARPPTTGKFTWHPSDMTVELAGSYRPPAAAAAGRWKPTGEMSRKTAGSMRKLAVNLKDRHPDIGAHAHVADAARALDRGDHDAAVRHLNAAVANMTPQSLYRHGVASDAEHMQAKGSMDEIHRHLLLVRDVQDAKANNDSLTAAPKPEDAPPTDDPGALAPNAPKPAARPGQAQAVNAPPGQNDGKPPVTASQPKPTTTTKWQVTKQVAASNSGDLTTALELSFLHHFDPSELRGRDGKWISSADLAEHADKDIPKTHDDDPGSRWTSPRAEALEAARNGEPHKAARLLRASTLGKNRIVTYTDYAAKAKKYADAFSKLPDDSPDETARENKFLVHHAAHPRLMEEEAARQSASLDRAAEKIKYGGEAAGHVSKAADSLRAMDFDGAAGHLDDARASIMGHGDNATAAGKMVDAAADRARKAADYSWDMKTYGLYQSAIAASGGGPAVDLSAKTGALAVTPAPRGKPGGPGLYGVKGNEHSPYMQQVVKALIEKRGMPPGKAYAIAYGAMRKWSKGGGKVHPEVRAAAAGGLVQEKAASARAHAHANAQNSVDLAFHFNPLERRGKAGKWSIGSAIAGEVLKKSLAGAGADPGQADVVKSINSLLGTVAAANANTQFGIRLPPGGHDLLAKVTPDNATAIVQKLHDSGMKMEDAAMVVAKTLNQSGAVGKAQQVVAADRAARGLASMSSDGVRQRVLELSWLKWDAGRGGATAKAHLAAHGITPGPKSGAQHLAQHITGNQGHSHPFMARMGSAIKKGLSDPNPGSDRETGPVVPGSGNWAYQRNMSNILALTGTTAGAAMDTHGVTGQFAPAGSPTGAKGKLVASKANTGGKVTPKARAKAVSAKIKATAKPKTNAQKKTALMATAKGDRAKASALEAKRKLLQSQLASAAGKVTTGQAGATSAKQAGATTKTTAPAAKATAKAPAKTTAKAAAAKLTTAQIKTQIAGLNTQINGLLKAAAAATAQAAKL